MVGVCVAVVCWPRYTTIIIIILRVSYVYGIWCINCLYSTHNKHPKIHSHAVECRKNQKCFGTGPQIICSVLGMFAWLLLFLVRSHSFGVSRKSIYLRSVRHVHFGVNTNMLSSCHTNETNSHRQFLGLCVWWWAMPNETKEWSQFLQYNFWLEYRCNLEIIMV